MSFNGFEQKLQEEEISVLKNISESQTNMILFNKNFCVIAKINHSSDVNRRLCVMRIVGNEKNKRVKIYTQFNKSILNELTCDLKENMSIHPTEPLLIIKNKLLTIKFNNNSMAEIIELFNFEILEYGTFNNIIMINKKIILKCNEKLTYYYINNPYFCKGNKYELHKINNIPYQESIYIYLIITLIYCFLDIFMVINYF